jgi:hypothetical protein
MQSDAIPVYLMRRVPRRYVPTSLPANLVYRTIWAAGGPSAVCRALGISIPTLHRWRRVGRMDDAQAVLTLVALVHPDDPIAQLTLARQLAGLARPQRRPQRKENP